VFLAIFQFLACWDTRFPQLSDFLPYPRTYSVCFSFSTFLSVSRHIPDPTVCVSHFPGFLTSLAIFQVVKCTFMFFHFFHCFSPYSRYYNVRFSFSSFQFCQHIPDTTVHVSHFTRFSCFSPYSRS
jgi:hypothetical protein